MRNTASSSNIGDSITFLNWLDPSTDLHFFQAYSDGEHKEGAQALSGSLSDCWPQLMEQNGEGFGVGVAINAVDGDRRRNENVSRIRAVWFDNDDPKQALPAFPLPPSVTVQTSPGRHHFYWLVSDRWDADAEGREDFRRLMQAMVALGSDRNATDLARALRLPGTWHQKGEPYLVTIVQPSSGSPPRYTRQELLDAFGTETVPAREHVSRKGGEGQQIDWQRVQAALGSIPSDDRETWIKVGMALHAATHGSQAGYDIWNGWSKGSAKYDPRETERQWHSFRVHPYGGIGIGSIFHLADQMPHRGRAKPFALDWLPGSYLPCPMEAPNRGLADKAITKLENTFAGWGHRPSSAQVDALRDLLKQLHALADGTAGASYYLSSLDPGIGKTQAVIHFVRELLADASYHDVAVLICVGRLAEIESYVLDMSLRDQDYSVLVADTGVGERLNRMGNPDRNQAKVLFITQQMLESRAKRQGSFGRISELFYRGAPRKVRLWDEACLPAKPLTIDATQIERLTDGARTSGNGKLFILVQSLIADIKEAESDSFVTIPTWESEGLELNYVIGIYNQTHQHDIEVIRDLFLLSGCTVSVHKDGHNRAFVHYEDTLPDDLKPVVICDASGRVRQTYPHWAQGRGDIVTLRDARKDYAALTVHLWKHGGSKGAWKSESKDQMSKAIVEVVNSKPDEEFLIVHHKESRQVGDLPKLLAPHIVNSSRINWTHWQSEDCKATNRFRDIPNIILAGTLFYPSSYYEALARLSRGVQSHAKLERKVRAEIEQGEHAHLILQAVCRGAVRQAVNGGCGQSNVWIIASAKSGIPDLVEGRAIFPGSQVVDWLPSDRAPVRGKAGEAISLIDQWSWEGEASRLPVSSIREAVGVRDRANFKKDILDHEGFKSALEERNIRYVSIPGRGGGSYLEKISEGQMAA